MGKEALRTAVKVDLKKEAYDQPYLHVSEKEWSCDGLKTKLSSTEPLASR